MPGYNALNPQAAMQPVPQPGAIQGAMNPSPLTEGPPTTPQELEQRKAGWESFLHGIVNDPAMRQSAMLVATTAMRGAGQGETGGNLLGRALQSGVLAHGMIKGNQQQLAVEQQKIQDSQAVNQSNIEQNTAQTEGIRQAQGYTSADRPGVLAGREAAARKNAFEESNQQKVLDAKIRNDDAERLKDEAQAGRDNRFRQFEPQGSGGRGGAAGIKEDFARQDTIDANPQQEGETPTSYKQRLAKLHLDRNMKSERGARVQALNAYLNNYTGDVNDTDYQDALKEARSLAGGGSGVSGSTEKPKGGHTKADFDAAAAGVKSGGTFKGPDGITYRKP